MSTPDAWADFRIVVPGFVSRTWRPGRMVSGIAIPGAGYHFFLDFPRGFANSSLLTRQKARRALLRGVWLLRYVVYRLLWLVPTLLAMALVTFLVMHATPGSPLDPVAEGANPLSPEAQKNLAEVYGLDKPLYAQFGIFLGKALQGDFGKSFVYKTRTVTEIMVETFPISLLLGSMALALAVVGGVTLGILAAVYQNRSWDYVSVSVATLGVSVPNFVLAVFLIVLFSFVLPIFPTGGWNSPKDWVLPTVTLALAPMGIIARFTRSSMLEVIRSDYIVTARAKGLAEGPVILKHVLKNGFIPVVTLLGPMFAAVGTGSFFVESIFRVPGMGRFFVLSMTGRDYPMIMAVVLVYGAFLALMNLVVDLLYGTLDPRIRY
jgi:peptide/nickel transport system permease protein